ncbi:endogenous retrovirus group K member 25 Pro protein-like [Meles meles]|uniref:endogenous retrovirus group K member 25 Pro protein-like n=1 Tax=Meles meles TaxID=9662 RepID=UPI001E699A7F|nr:endogenous retrovirus group K member 25 Pro protein-like [Meles meles]
MKGRRVTGGFGSTDICWAQLISADKPYLTLKIQGRDFWGLVDTGVDISVIAFQHWPRNWPLVDSDTSIKGVGQAHAPKLSANFLNLSTAEGHQGVFQPFVLQIDLNLWDHEVLADMGVSLALAPIHKNEQHSVAMALMKKMGYKQGKGLGKNL